MQQAPLQYHPLLASHLKAIAYETLIVLAGVMACPRTALWRFDLTAGRNWFLKVSMGVELMTVSPLEIYWPKLTQCLPRNGKHDISR